MIFFENSLSSSSYPFSSRRGAPNTHWKKECSESSFGQSIRKFSPDPLVWTAFFCTRANIPCRRWLHMTKHPFHLKKKLEWHFFIEHFLKVFGLYKLLMMSFQLLKLLLKIHVSDMQCDSRIQQNQTKWALQRMASQCFFKDFVDLHFFACS